MTRPTVAGGGEAAKRCRAVRLTRDLKADKPGGLVQIDIVFVNPAPGEVLDGLASLNRLNWAPACLFALLTPKSNCELEEANGDL